MIRLIREYIKLFKNNIAIGIDVFIMPDGSHSYSLCKVIKNKGGLDIQDSIGETDSVEELKRAIDKNTPVYLSINGRGIIHKKLKVLEGSDENGYLSELLPGDASPKDFLIQLVPANKGYLFVSIIKRSILEEVVSLLQRHHIDFNDCVLGPWYIKFIFPFLSENQSSELKFGRHLVDHSDGTIVDYQLIKDGVDVQVELSGLKIADNRLLAFSNALEHFFNTGFLSAGKILWEESISNLNQKRKFRLILPAFIVLLVLFVGVGFATKYSLSMKKRTLLSKVALYDNDLKRLEELNTIYEEKVSFIERSGIRRMSKSSYYVDRVLKSVPQGIVLEEVDYCPAKKDLANDSIVNYQTEVVYVNGTCNRSSELNGWMNDIKKEEFANKVELEDYKQEKRSIKSNFRFSIALK